MSRVLVDSGIQWLGKIPENWVIKRLKNVLNERNEMNSCGKETFILSLTISDGVIPYSEKKSGGNKSKEDITKYKIAKKNDIIINSMNVVVGASGISKYDGIISPVYYSFYEKNKISDHRYYYYLFRNITFQHHLFGMGNGILVKISESSGKMNTIRKKIPIDKIKNDYVPYPKFEEQVKIANYLNKQCSEIDEIINDNNREIELLEEYKRTILINELSKKTGWKKYRIKNIASLKGRIGWQGLKTSDYIEEGPYLITGIDFNDNNGTINWKSCVHISQERYNEAPEIHVLPNDLLITKDGTIGKLAIISENREASLNSGVMLIRIKDKSVCNVKYLYYLLKSDYFWDWYNSSQRGSSTIKHLYQEQFYNFSFFLPDLAHQEKVIKKIDDQFFKLDQVINYRKQIIEKLEEYKKSLIYECVTGKREV